MNRLTIKLFATLRERARAAELSREFPDGATVGEIWKRLHGGVPGARGPSRRRSRFAVNQEYVDEDYRPRNDDEIAFIPPVSGGVDPTAHGRGSGRSRLAANRSKSKRWNAPSPIRRLARR